MVALPSRFTNIVSSGFFSGASIPSNPKTAIHLKTISAIEAQDGPLMDRTKWTPAATKNLFGQHGVEFVGGVGVFLKEAE